MNEYTKRKLEILDFIRKKELYEKYGEEVQNNINEFEKCIQVFNSTGFVDLDLVKNFICYLNNITKDYNGELNEQKSN